MSNMRIVHDNAASRAALAASSTAGVLAASNLQLDDKSSVWRATGTTARLTATWSSSESIGAVALPFCNLSPTATMRVRLTNEAPTTNLLTVPSSQFENWGSAPGSVRYVLAPDGTNTAVVPNPDASTDRWQITIQADTHINGTVLIISWFQKTVAPLVGAGQGLNLTNWTGANPGPVQSAATPSPNGFTRKWAAATITDTANSQNLRFYTPVVGADDMAAWGWMMEKASYSVGQQELVVNGTFNSDTSGWSAMDGATFTVGGGIAVQTNSASGTQSGYAVQIIPTVAGQVYLATCDFVKGTAPRGRLAAGSYPGGSIDLGMSESTASGKLTFFFTAISATTYISVYPGYTTASITSMYDNISVKPVNWVLTPSSYYPTLNTFTSRASTATYIDSDGLLKTAAANVARYQYYPASPADAPKLLLEGGATNLATASGTLTTGWSGCAVVASGVKYRGLDTYQAVSKTLTSPNEYRGISLGAVTAGQALTATVALRAGSDNLVTLGLYDSSANSWGTNAAASCTILEGPGAVAIYAGASYVISGLSDTVDTVVQITRVFGANGTAGFYIYPGGSGSTVAGRSILATRVQVENGASPTSYIPTAAATASRAADVYTTAPGVRPLGFIDGWQSYDYDSGNLPACPAPSVKLRGWTPAQAASAYSYGGGACARYWLPANQQAAGLTVDIADPNNLQGYVEAACLVAGPYWSPKYNASQASATIVDTTRLYRNDAGGQGAEAGYAYRSIPVDLSLMPPSDRATFANIIRNSRAYPVLLSVYPGVADLSLERDNTVYGRRTKDSGVASQFALAYSTTLAIEEI